MRAATWSPLLLLLAALTASACVAVSAAHVPTTPPTTSPTATPPTPPAPPPETPMSIAVRQRAAVDFGCDAANVAVSARETRGTMTPGRKRESFSASGCGHSASYVAVCATDDDGNKSCDAVVAEGNAEQMSPFGG